MMNNRQKIADACLLLLATGFTLSRNGVSKGPTVAAPKAAPAPSPAPAATTADGRHLYTCGKCGATGHNVRKCPTVAAATKAAPAAPKTTPGKAPNAAPAPRPSIALADLDFDLGDLGGAQITTPTLPAPKPTPTVAAPKPAPTPNPAPAEASDSEVDDFLRELDDVF